jgi:hypothetical protein
MAMSVRKRTKSGLYGESRPSFKPEFSWMRDEPELSATREHGFRRKERLPQKQLPAVQPKPAPATVARPAVLTRPLAPPPITALASLRSFAKTRNIQVEVKIRGKWVSRDLGSIIDNLRSLGVTEQELAKRFGLGPLPYELLKKKILDKIREEEKQ